MEYRIELLSIIAIFLLLLGFAYSTWKVREKYDAGIRAESNITR